MRRRRPGSACWRREGGSARPAASPAAGAGARWSRARRREAARTGPGSGEAWATQRGRSRTTRCGPRPRRAGCPSTRTGWTSGCSCWWTWCCSCSCTCGRDGLPDTYIKKLAPGLDSENDYNFLNTEDRQDCSTEEFQTLRDLLSFYTFVTLLGTRLNG